MHSRAQAFIFGSTLSVLVLLIALPAAQATPTASPLNLSITGEIVNSGQQSYSQSGAGLSCAACFATILGWPVDPSTASFTENLSTFTTGVTTTGSGSLSLSGTLANGSSFSLAGPIAIAGAIPGEAFPLPCWNEVSLPLPASCTSDVPVFYLGEGNFSVTVTHTWSLDVGMEMESAFLNPFGGAIVWASADNASSVLLSFNYTAAAIDWSGVQVAGTLNGTLGTSPDTTLVSGQFIQNTSAHEDLFAGTETESGGITFFDMTPSGLDTTGTFSGNSVIPTNGSEACWEGTTNIPGTCTITGFTSSGTLSLDPVTVLVQADYVLDWTVPAVGFTGSAIGTATPNGSTTVPGVPQFGSSVLIPVAFALPLLFFMKNRRRRSLSPQ